MALPTALLAKGLAGLSATVAVVAVGVKSLTSNTTSQKTELTQDQKTLVQSVNVPERCKYPGEICELTIEELKLINFSNKQENKELTIPQTNAKVDLTITELSNTEKTAFNNHPIKFNFKISNANLDIKIGDNDSNKITLLKNTNYEFKINDQNKLEKAWKKITDIEEKIGLSGCNVAAGVNRCILTTAKINIITKDGVRKKQMDVGSEYKSKNISYQEDAEGYNNGFKICFSEKIELVDSSTNTQETIALETKDNYEIKFIEDDWYLSKVEIVS